MTAWIKISAKACVPVLVVLSVVGCPARVGQLGWVYSLAQVDAGAHIAQLSDGGYFISGNSHLSGSAPQDFLLAAVRISASGNLIWGNLVDGLHVQGERTFGIPVTDSETIVSALSEPYDDSAGRLRVLKLDGNGNTLWDRTFGEDKQEPRAICSSGDGGCVIAGQRTIITAQGGSASGYSYTFQVFLRKLDSLGGAVWEHYLESPTGFMGVYRMIVDSANGFVLVGSDSQILRVDAEGNALWWNQYGEGWATATGLGMASDGGLIVVGTSVKSLPTPVVFKTDANGNLLWTAEDIIPNQGTSQYTVRDAIVDTQGRIVIVGQLQRVTYIGNFFPVISYGGFIMQLDSSAHMNWSKALDVYEINGITQTSSGDYATTGSDGDHLQVVRVNQSGSVM